MHTRWHDEDLAGRITRRLDAIGRPYRTPSLPALLGDPLGRETGEYLWDDDARSFGDQFRQRKQDCDTRTWENPYQRNPVPERGTHFERDRLRPMQGPAPREGGRNVYGASDCAVTRDGGDHTSARRPNGPPRSNPNIDAIDVCY